MRQPTLVRLVAVSLSLGLSTLVPAGTAAQSQVQSQPQPQPQQNEIEMAVRALSRRVQIPLAKDAAAVSISLKLAPNLFGSDSNRIKLESIGDPAFGPPMDCNMPVIEGDPSIDPKILVPLPKDAATHSMRIIRVPRCAHPR